MQNIFNRLGKMFTIYEEKKNQVLEQFPIYVKEPW